MMSGKKKKAKRIGSLLLAGALLVGSGCGGGRQSVQEAENIALVDPVGVALNYEKAARRTIYDEKVCPALVCPYTVEHALNEEIYVTGFDAYPGEAVRKGDLLLHGDMEKADEEIKTQREKIRDMEKEYREYQEDILDSYKEIRENYDKYQQIVKNLEAEKPEELIDDPEDTSDDPAQIPNPEYLTWQQQYKTYDGLFRNADLALMRWEQDKKKRADLYELDHAYEELILKRKQQDRLKLGMVSKIDGTVTSIILNSSGWWVNADTPLMAVADLEQKEIRCEYVSKNVVKRAKDIYALIGGKRVEVEYQNMEPDEYKRIAEKNEKVYSTFHIVGDTADIELGSFAVIVLVNNVAKDVLTVPKDAVERDETTSYVYVVDGSESIYTPVKTGVSDGGYIEIVSGLEEGTPVLTQQAAIVGNKTKKLEKGEVHYNFKNTGFFYYPSSQWVKNPVEYGTCYYVENRVSFNQQVQKGDVLAKVRVVPDSVELQRQETKLLRQQERMEKLRAQDEEKNKKQIARMEEEIAELQKQIREMKASFAVTEIKAPTNGVITNISEWESEEMVPRDANMYQIADDQGSYVLAIDENVVLSYGNEVTITYREGNKDQTLTGQVVSSNPMSVSKALTTENKMYLRFGNDAIVGSLIKISPEDIGKLAGSLQDGGWWNQGFYTVEATIRKMDQVVLVPKSAVKDFSGTTYVRVKQSDGEVKYQSFVPGGSDANNFWVVDGLTEGMEICIE